MRRKLRIQDRILLVMADIGDLLEELHDPGGWMKNYYQTLYGWVPYRYKRSNYRAVVERMLRVGYIKKIIKNGEAFIGLTFKGKKKLVRDFPIVSLVGKKWNGIGTLVTFDVKEAEREKRDKLRPWLLALGAGQVQRSVYLFAFDLAFEVNAVVKNFGLEKEVKVFPSNFEFVGDRKEFARGVWKLDRLEKDYGEILEEIKKTAGRKGREKEKLICKAKQRFLEVLLLDPMLPGELLPRDWIGERVKKAIKELV
jgi:phenylacetic acid degradation operon negative regulatory protein